MDTGGRKVVGVLKEIFTSEAKKFEFKGCIVVEDNVIFSDAKVVTLSAILIGAVRL